VPELPEVETVVRGLRTPLIGETFIEVVSDWPRQLNGIDLPELQARLSGRSIQSINRRGKYLVLELDAGENLIIHLKMSGQLSVSNGQVPADKHVHTVFLLASGSELRFRDIRKFGRVYLVRDPEEVLGKLGQEPLEEEFTSEWLCQEMGARRRVLKPLLLDQTFIAGIGNIYADEALHRAAIHPRRQTNSLTTGECLALHEAIQTILSLAIEHEGSSIDAAYIKPDGGRGSMQSELRVYGRAGEPCHRCGSIIERVTLAGRGTHYCPGCQI
jgi:formamidopyrimidine-DNA glycosylase